MEQINPTLMFVMQAILAVLMIFFGFILNGMRASVERVSTDLKSLNDAVLGKYVQRADADALWLAQRTLDHELRGEINRLSIALERVKLGAKPE